MNSDKLENLFILTSPVFYVWAIIMFLGRVLLGAASLLAISDLWYLKYGLAKMENKQLDGFIKILDKKIESGRLWPHKKYVYKLAKIKAQKLLEDE